MRPLLNNRASCIQATQQWFERIVIGRKLCPFASPFLTHPELLRITPCDTPSVDHVVQEVHREVDFLVGRTRQDTIHRHETTLIVFPERKSPLVDDFRDLVRLSWTLQEEAIGAEYQPKLQLVLFHPKATHQTYGSELENAADYTIRSPYPTIHLLREVDVLKAVKSGYPNLEALPARNQKRFHDYGVESCQKRLAECYESDVTGETK